MNAVVPLALAVQVSLSVRLKVLLKIKTYGLYSTCILDFRRVWPPNLK